MAKERPGWVQQIEANRADLSYALKREAFKAISSAKTFDEIEAVVLELTRSLADASTKWQQLLEERKAALVVPAPPPTPLPRTRDYYQAQISSPENTWVDTTNAAKMIGCSKAHMELLRADRTGPPFRKIGRLVRYNVAALQAWMQQS